MNLNPELPGDARFLRGYSLSKRAWAGLARGISRERSGDLLGALKEFSAVIKLNPRCPGVYTLRSAVRHHLGDRAAAIEDAHRAIELHPENLDAFVRLAYLSDGRRMPHKMRPNQQEELIDVAERIITREPGSAWAYVLRAEAVGRRWSAADALRSLRDLKLAVKLDPKRAWMRAFLGRALSANEEPQAMKEGLLELSAALRLAPKSGWMRTWRAQVLGKLGRSRRALADLNRGLKLDPQYRLACAWRAEVKEKLGDYSGAAKDMTRCLAVLPRATFYHRRALILWRLKRRFQALEDLTRCAALGLHHDFGYGGLEFLLNLFDNVGQEWRRERAGALMKARPILRQIQGKLFNNKTEVSCSAASSLFLPLDCGELEKAARRFPHQALTRAWLGRAYLNAGRWADGLRSLSEALALNPRCAPALAWRGEVRCRTGDYEGAACDLKAALALDNFPASAGLWLGASLIALERREEGLECWRKAAGADPSTANLVFWWSRWIMPGARAPRLGRVL